MLGSDERLNAAQGWIEPKMEPGITGAGGGGGGRISGTGKRPDCQGFLKPQTLHAQFGRWTMNPAATPAAGALY